MINMQRLNNDKYKDSKHINNTLDALLTSVCHTKHIISPISGVVNTFMVTLPKLFLPVSLML